MVTKILRSLPSRYNYIVVEIIEAKDVTTITLEELSSSLQIHEAKMNQTETTEAALFQVKSEGTTAKYEEETPGFS